MNEPTASISYDRIPKHFVVAGQMFEVRHIERCADNAIGMCKAAECIIEIADKYNQNDTQHPLSRVNTFYHELVHAILINIGWDELNDDHKFVCSFAALLTEAMRDARFIVKANE